MSALTVHCYRSRIDLLVAVVLIVPCVIMARAWFAQARQGSEITLILAFAFLASTGLALWLLLNTSYTITDTELVARGGPLRVRLPLASIRRVRGGRTLIAAPALSLRRLEIDYGTGGLAVISPAHENDFPATIHARVPLAEHPAPLRT